MKAHSDPCCLDLALHLGGTRDAVAAARAHRGAVGLGGASLALGAALLLAAGGGTVGIIEISAVELDQAAILVVPSPSPPALVPPPEQALD